MESHLFYYFESPESSPAQEVYILGFSYFFIKTFSIFSKSISRLIQYLDSHLVIFKDHMIKTNFERLLKKLWITLMAKIKEQTIKDNSVDFLIII